MPKNEHFPEERTDKEGKMTKGQIIKRGATPMFAMVCGVTDGGVKLRMVATNGPYVYRNTEVYSVDLLAHFGWRVVGGVDHV